MMPLFSKSSLTVLESLTFTKTLYAFDFDGTLARIVREPSAARMTSNTTGLLTELCRLAPVAVISGRSAHDLRQRLGFEPPFLAGNHGLEGSGLGQLSLLRAKQNCHRWVSSLESAGFGPGVEIEDKRFSIAVHYRRSRQKAADKIAIERAIASLCPTPRVLMGKCVYNLVPANAPHKGIALLKIMEKVGARHAFYIGDDETDEDVFDLAYNKGQLMTVRVGRKLRSRARFFVEKQSDINRVLQSLIRFHGGQT